ncbi:MAG: ATP-binding protein [Thermodesulfobacteriota bacterium]
MGRILFRALRKFSRSLSFKLSFFAGLVVFLVLMIFTFHAVKSQEQNLTDKVVQGAIKDSRIVKAAIWNGMMNNQREVIREIILAVGQLDRFLEIRLLDDEGVVQYASSPKPGTQTSKKRIDLSLKEFEKDPKERHWVSSSGDSLHLVDPIMNSRNCSTAACHAHPEEKKVLGALAMTVSFGSAREDFRNYANKTRIFAVVLFVVVSSAIGLAIVFLVNPGLKKLQESAALMAVGGYLPRSETYLFDEIEEVGRVFDDASRRISERTTRLSESRKLYRSLFELVPCYLTVVDRDYKIVRANRAFEVQFGNVVGMDCFAGYKGRRSRCPECLVERTFADGQPHESEEIWKVDGETAHVIVKTAPMVNDKGDITQVLEMGLNVTELVRLQKEVEKKQKEYKELFDRVPCYLTVVSKDFRVIQSNSLFKKDFGSVTDDHCFKIYKGLDEKCSNCPVEQTFQDGKSHTSEEVWLREGEETNIVVHTAALKDDRGRIASVLEMSTNITEVKRLESELALLGETIAGMSHTIKNILGGLQGGVYLLDSGLERGREDRIGHGWMMVKKNVELISDLVKGILFAAKRREPEFTVQDPGQLLKDVCDLFESKAAGGNVQLVRDFEEHMDPGLIDGAGIHSALSNLISNAIDACREVEERPRVVTVSGRRHDGRLWVEVSDNGPGIPHEVRDRLFNKFFSTKGHKGTGLGLLLTRKVIKEHRGSIRVESALGRGTAFVIEIPCERVQDDRSDRQAV